MAQDQKTLRQSKRQCILVDTREKQPWAFKVTKRKTLLIGDYTIQGGTTKVLIERKGSIYDLYQTMRPRNRARFMENMQRAAESVDWVFLVLETSLASIYRGVRECPVPPHVVVDCLIELIGHGVNVIFTGGGKRTGRDFAERLLRTFGNFPKPTNHVR